MTKIKKITIDDVLAQKKLKKAHEMFYDSDVLCGRIDFERINANKVLDIMSDVNAGNLDIFDACMYIIYLSVPMFRNKEVIEDNKGESPYKVVAEIFNDNIIDISAFAQKIFAIYGVDDEAVKTLKK